MEHSLSRKSNAWNHNPEKSWRTWELCIKARNFDLGLQHKSKQYVEERKEQQVA